MTNVGEVKLWIFLALVGAMSAACSEADEHPRPTLDGGEACRGSPPGTACSSVSDLWSCIQKPFESSATCLSICSTMRCYSCIEHEWQPTAVDCARQTGDSGTIEDASVDTHALTRDQDALVHPGRAYRACQTTADCALVSVGCNGCCQVAAISSQLRGRFEVEFAAACRGYQGAQCDCSPPALGPVCVDNVCTEAPTR